MLENLKIEEAVCPICGFNGQLDGDMSISQLGTGKLILSVTTTCPEDNCQMTREYTTSLQ